jgi:hypothetical protein
LPKPPDLWFPRPRRWSVWAIAISLALHGMIFLIKVKPWLVPPRRPPTLIVLVPPGAETPGPLELRYEVRGGTPLARQGSPGAPIRPPEQTRVLPEPRPTPLEPVPSEPSPLVAAPPAPAPAPADSGRGTVRPGTPGYRIGPALGEGKLWVQPLPAPPREIAEALGTSHIELVDSAVSAIVQAYIDSVLNAPASPGSAPPSWTTQIFGKTFGIDSKYIYLGGLKIPSAVLAFLPIKGGGMTMEYSKASRMGAIREDLIYAAQRAGTLDDFRRAVRELRAERERQRELEKNQRKPQGEGSDTTRKVPPKIP